MPSYSVLAMRLQIKQILCDLLRKYEKQAKIKVTWQQPLTLHLR